MTKVSSNLKEKIPVNERQQRGTSLFPLEYNFCNTENPYYDLWLHWHTEFELIHILSGTYNLFLSDHEIVLNKGDSCIIPGKIVHGDAPDKGASKYESAVFDIELLRQHGFSPDSFINDIILENISLKNYIPAEQKDIFTTIEFLFDTIREQREGFDIIASGALIVFFGLLKKNHFYSEKKILPAQKRARNKKLDLVLDFIKKNYGNDISLEQLSVTAGFSPKYFCRVFKEMTGRSPVEYLNWFRISRSCALLRESNDKHLNIAQKCGFKDFSYFIKMFHRYKGMTPLKYRNMELKSNKISEAESTQKENKIC
ncbi:AraC family transcriptional regulator [Treponema succinifaciens]|uniref:AraC family transcriptional regulator n=1 Tax=Treponema succinifaciens TaxID=167 RepID=UPI003FEE7384